MVVIRKRTKAKQTLCAPQGTARPPSTMRPPPPDQKESRPTPDLKRTQRKNSRQPTPATKGWGGVHWGRNNTPPVTPTPPSMSLLAMQRAHLTLVQRSRVLRHLWEKLGNLNINWISIDIKELPANFFLDVIVVLQLYNFKILIF